VFAAHRLHVGSLVNDMDLFSHLRFEYSGHLMWCRYMARWLELQNGHINVV
jgi:hypothetical protein